MRVVESFQDSEDGGQMIQGVARASLNPVLRCVIPPGSSDLIVNLSHRKKVLGVLVRGVVWWYQGKTGRFS